MLGFGRRKNSTSSQTQSPPTDPTSWQPYAKMDAALTGAIYLFTEALEQAGKDCGSLAIRGAIPPKVGELLADCVIYPDKDGQEFVTLGLTTNLEAFSYQPHCRLFLMINAALILQEVWTDRSLRDSVAVSQVPSTLVEAHLLRRWIKAIGPLGKVIAAGNFDQILAVNRPYLIECMSLKASVPSWIARQINIDACIKEWCSGIPAAIARPLTADVKRINNLPVTDFVADLIKQFLVETQMRGLREAR